MYPAFEDLEEPCSLHLGPDSIVVTYQMKSIIAHFEWRDIKHLKALQLRDDQDQANNRRRRRRGSVEIDRHNILKVRMLDGHHKLFRFDSRRILDEFLMAAIRAGQLCKLVYKRLLLTRIKYVPAPVSDKPDDVDEDDNYLHEDGPNGPHDDNHNWAPGPEQPVTEQSQELREEREI